MAHTPESADAPIGFDEKMVDATIAETSRICPRRRRRTLDLAGRRRPDIDKPEAEKKRPSQAEPRGDRRTGSQSGDGKPEGRISSTPDGAAGGGGGGGGGRAGGAMRLPPPSNRQWYSERGVPAMAGAFSYSFQLYSTAPVHAAGLGPVALSLQRSAAIGGPFATDYRLIWSSYVELLEPERPEC